MDLPGRPAYRDAMPEWLAIEVYDGAFPASMWRRAHDDFLSEAGLTNGASVVDWHTTRWGAVVEIAFSTDEQLERFRGLPAVRAALDAVPDPVTGLVVYRGRGGGAGAFVPRRPGPVPVAGTGGACRSRTRRARRRPPVLSGPRLRRGPADHRCVT